MAVVAGVIGLKYNYQLVGFTGSIDFVEKYLGAGSTYAFLKFMALMLIVGGFVYMIGFGEPALRWLLSPLDLFFKGFRGEPQ